MLEKDPLATLEALCQGELSTILYPLDHLRGLIFAVAAAPEIPMPEQWLLWVFQEHGQLRSSRQADQLADVLMGALQEQLLAMRDEQIQLPAHYRYPDDAVSTNPVSQWFTGLLAGHSQLETVWQDAWQRVADKAPEKLSKMQKDLKHCLGMFSTFADIPLALRQAADQGNHQLAEKLPQVYQSLPLALKSYVDLSGLLVEFLPDQFETFVQNHEQK